jgi:hypothetical protein
MEPSASKPSLEELQAGHALADLDAQELAAWHELASEQNLAPDAALEWIAAQLEIESAQQSPETIPHSLVATLLQNARDGDTATVAPETTTLSPAPATRSQQQGWWGWAVAACLAILLTIQWLQKPATLPSPAPLEVTQALFLREAPDLIRLPLSGTTGDYATAKGEVQWSDAKQQGYLMLEDLPVNNPKEQQYQLWIVDPKRDEIPVDGGVFDVTTSGDSPVIIEIHAKLTIEAPQAFVITVEQPGGVVRSKQQIVAGIAKAQP